MVTSPDLIACLDCDLLHRSVVLPSGGVARCQRCGAPLYRPSKDVLERSLALACASAILFLVANAFPFLDFEVGGQVQTCHLLTGVTTLMEQGFPFLAFTVLLTSLLAPAAMITSLLLVSGLLLTHRRPSFLKPLVRFLDRLKPWSMMEVYLLGAIVSVVKLMSMADIRVGLGSWAFVGLILTLTAAVAAFDPAAVWDELS